MRLIDADAFAEYLGLEDTDEAREMNYGEIVTLEDFDTQPTVDAVEVKRGHWDSRGRYFRCSECKVTLASAEEMAHCTGGKWNYCPHCGAKMDEVEHKC